MFLVCLFVCSFLVFQRLPIIFVYFRSQSQLFMFFICLFLFVCFLFYNVFNHVCVLPITIAIVYVFLFVCFCLFVRFLFYNVFRSSLCTTDHNRKILDSSKLENDTKKPNFSDMVENIVERAEISCNEHFLLFPQLVKESLFQSC